MAVLAGLKIDSSLYFAKGVEESSSVHVLAEGSETIMQKFHQITESTPLKRQKRLRSILGISAVNLLRVEDVQAEHLPGCSFTAHHNSIFL